MVDVKVSIIDSDLYFKDESGGIKSSQQDIARGPLAYSESM